MEVNTVLKASPRGSMAVIEANGLPEWTRDQDTPVTLVLPDPQFTDVEPASWKGHEYFYTVGKAGKRWRVLSRRRNEDWSLSEFFNTSSYATKEDAQKCLDDWAKYDDRSTDIRPSRWSWQHTMYATREEAQVLLDGYATRTGYVPIPMVWVNPDGCTLQAQEVNILGIPRWIAVWKSKAGGVGLWAGTAECTFDSMEDCEERIKRVIQRSLGIWRLQES